MRLVNKGGAEWRVKRRLSTKSFKIFHSTNSQGWRHTQWKVNQKHYFESTWVMQKIVGLENVPHICWKWKAPGTIMLLWGLSYCCSSNAWRFSIWTPYYIKARQTKVSLPQLRIFFWVVKTLWKSVRLCSLIKSSHWVSVIQSCGLKSRASLVLDEVIHNEWGVKINQERNTNPKHHHGNKCDPVNVPSCQTNLFTWSFSLRS